MTDPQHIRNLLHQSQPDVYRTDGDITLRSELQRIAHENPQLVLSVLLDDLIWRMFLETLTGNDKTPSLEQIVALAQSGDFDRAYERTRLAFHLEKDKQILSARFKEALQTTLAKK